MVSFGVGNDRGGSSSPRSQAASAIRALPIARIATFRMGPILRSSSCSRSINSNKIVPTAL